MIPRLTVIVLCPILVSARKYCTYGQSCWPSANTWSAFNSSVSGRLISITPPAAVCHGGLYNESSCAIARANWNVGYWRADQPGASQNTNWENGESRCFINEPRETLCEQGRVPVLGVAAENVTDIQTAVEFAAKHNLYLVVKNTGHDL
jgi:hypothetical protein